MAPSNRAIIRSEIKDIQRVLKRAEKLAKRGGDTTSAVQLGVLREQVHDPAFVDSFSRWTSFGKPLQKGLNALSEQRVELFAQSGYSPEQLRTLSHWVGLKGGSAATKAGLKGGAGITAGMFAAYLPMTWMMYHHANIEGQVENSGQALRDFGRSLKANLQAPSRLVNWAKHNPPLAINFVAVPVAFGAIFAALKATNTFRNHRNVSAQLIEAANQLERGQSSLGFETVELAQPPASDATDPTPALSPTPLET